MSAIGPQPWNDITDAFAFVEETLVYVDAPLEGHLESRDGELFAFRCSEIVAHKLFHWVLLPAHSLTEPIEEVFARARRDPPTQWISIVEDRRAGRPALTAAPMSGADAIPR